MAGRKKGGRNGNPIYKHTKKQLIEAVEACNGTYTSLAKILGMKNSSTAQKHIEADPDLKKMMDDKQSLLLDIAEDALMKNLNSSNEFVRARAAEFILKYLPGSRYKDKPQEDVQLQLVKILDRMMTNTDPTK